jgi:hypothetical protein
MLSCGQTASDITTSIPEWSFISQFTITHIILNITTIQAMATNITTAMTIKGTNIMANMIITADESLVPPSGNSPGGVLLFYILRMKFKGSV